MHVCYLAVRNLRYIRKFAELVTNSKLQTLSAVLSWSHNTYLFDKTKTLEEYLWYAAQTIENGWSLSALEYHVSRKTYARQEMAEKTTNYKEKLPLPFSKFATETLKDPYVFDFVEQREGIIEREIEDELVANVARTILELGTGFAFVGNQYHLEVSNKDYYIDLLFYNTKLRCEYKLSDFVPQELADTLPSAEDIEKRIKGKYEIEED